MLAQRAIILTKDMDITRIIIALWLSVKRATEAMSSRLGLSLGLQVLSLVATFQTPITTIITTQIMVQQRLLTEEMLIAQQYTTADKGLRQQLVAQDHNMTML